MPDRFQLVDAGRGRHPSTPPIAVNHSTTEVNRTGSWKYIRPMFRDRVAPCNQGCPAGVDVEGTMELLRQGRIDEAAELLAREHPMPAISGRVCNHPCEDACNRADFDGAVAIHAVERMLGDRLLRMPLPTATVQARAECVAVVGSGPAGLACAYHLARLGYRVDVIERDAEAGGVLRHGIPAYRLPREVLDRQLERIQALGVRIDCGVSVDQASWRSLRERYAAVFVATGAGLPRRLALPGCDLPGVWQGLDFLRRVNAGERPDLGGRAVVIGGGNTAMDCARTALRLGARPLVVYRRSRDEMPAIREEVEEAEREGVEFLFLASPTAFRGDHGVLDHVACARMALGEPGPDGRRLPRPTGEGVDVPASAVLLATGEDAEPGPLPANTLHAGAAAVDEWGATSLPLVFAGGDVAGDERTVARALGAGKRAAIGIDRALRMRREAAPPGAGMDALRWGPQGAPSIGRWRGDDPVRRTNPVNEVVAFEDVNLAYFERVARHPDRVGAAAGFDEVNAGLADDVALREAGRCFQCGVCNDCEICMLLCADVAIHRHNADSGPPLEFALDYCKGCGVCAYECPRGAIAMTREGL